MRVVYFGTPQAAVPPLRALLDSGHDLAAVVTRPDKPRDHTGGRPSPSPVKRVAEAAGLPVLQPARGRDPQLPGALAGLRADVGVSCAFGLLLPRPVLDAFPAGILNIHFSLLPAYRGAAPVQHALLDGVAVTGVTIFRIDEGMDTGPVLTSEEVPVAPDEPAGELTGRLAEVGARLLLDTLDGLQAGAIVPRPQPEAGASLAPKVAPEQACLDLRLPARKVVDTARAFAPRPGAWTTLRGRRLKVLRASLPEAPPPAPPGVTSAAQPRPAPDGRPQARALDPGELAVDEAGGLLAGAGDGPVRLDLVQPEGRRAMPGADFARGARLRPGERLGT
ncbi:MAG TPA: methionyl-tRNA formyltransferase [Actinomycetes bacterium]|nr:methionyl-tRNA formyltransferase [Actinomycetes bacterium]